VGCGAAIDGERDSRRRRRRRRGKRWGCGSRLRRRYAVAKSILDEMRKIDLGVKQRK